MSLKKDCATPTSTAPEASERPLSKLLKLVSSKQGRITLGIVIGSLVALATKGLSEYILEQNIAWSTAAIPSIVIIIIVILLLWTTKEFAYSHNWQILAIIASSKALMLISVALTIVPLVLSVFQAANRQDLLPFDLYLYWVSGLSFLAFILVYKVTAPKVFQYPSYRELMDREGSVRVLRASLAELQELEKSNQPPFSSDQRSEIPTSDINAIHTLETQSNHHQEHIYFLLREYSKNLAIGARHTLSALLIAPTFLMITITFSKMFIVWFEAQQSAQCYGGWIKATYWNMMKLNTNIITSDKFDSTQECLRNLVIENTKSPTHD